MHGLSMPRRFHAQALLSGERLLQQPGGAGGGPTLRAALVPEGAELPAAVLRAWASPVFRFTADWPSDQGANTRGLRLGGHALSWPFCHLHVALARRKALDVLAHQLVA